MRFLYSLLWYMALPLVLIKLWRRGAKEPGYRQHIAERFGFYQQILPTHQRIIWLHAVSVGETRAAEPLILALLKTYPDCTILLTHMTASGRATGQTLFAQLGNRLIQSFLPYDTACMTRRFLSYFRPQLGILMETEVWPNLIHQCQELGIPIMLANARLSEKSLRQGRRLGRLMSDAGHELALVAAQTEDDAERLKQFGAQQIVVTGSLKFDVPLPDNLLALGKQWREFVGQRSVLLCASTRDGEEQLIIEQYNNLPKNWLLVIVPRHPQRFNDVAQQIQAAGLKTERRSVWLGNKPLASDTQVLIGDSMGEMVAYYAMSDMAFIGGSLLPLGGQNLIEACAVGVPVLLGPHTFNFEESSRDAIRMGAGIRIQDAAQLMHQITELDADRERLTMMSQAAKRFAAAFQGATNKTINSIKTLIK